MKNLFFHLNLTSIQMIYGISDSDGLYQFFRAGIRIV